MKRCPACRTTKALSDFPPNRARSDGVQSLCRECRRVYMREHYLRNAPRYHESWRRRNQRHREAIRQIVRTAKDRPCLDCGRQYPTFVMDFDHRDRTTKRFNIGRDGLNRASLRAIREEIAKCDVVCANGHRERTYQRRLLAWREKVLVDCVD